MNCRNCMTRVSAGTRRCPNCGRDITHPADEAETPPLAPARVPRAEGKRKAEPKERAPQPPERAPQAPERAQQPPRAPAAKLAALTLEPADVLALAAATPDVIEPGLRVHKEGGRPVGVGFPTDVGAIDLLAQDDAGGLVVVMVAEGEPGKEVVLDLLERIGFVRTRVARNGQEVRGLLLAERLSEPTRYAIAALGGTVSVKTWRVALTFDDLPV